jgi:hypothetical protein
MPEAPSGHELLREWRKVMDATISSLSSLGDQVGAPQQVLEAMRRQLELVQELIARERRLQKLAVSQLLAPVDAGFELLEASGATLRKQAEALGSAGQALEETARLVEAQAVLFERAVASLRGPSNRARSVFGLEPPGRQEAQQRASRRPARRGTTPA